MTSKRPTESKDKPSSLSRRNLLKGAAIGGSSLILGKALAGQSTEKTTAMGNKSVAAGEIPFYGTHQSGITTPAQGHVYLMMLKLDNTDRQAVIELFQEWTKQSALLMQGKNIEEYGSNKMVPPVDTGEADSLSAYGLTITFGVAPSFLDKLGLQDKAPADFKPLPHFPRDQLKEQYTGGDICIQSCADDPQVAFHAVRQLVRFARTSMVSMVWAQTGFNSQNNKNETPRNLFAFKDGTANRLTLGAPNEHIWVNDQNWMKDGSYMAVRRIEMHIETWDRTSYSEQENTFGRHKATGAPMGQKGEFDIIDTSLKAMPEDSHVHLAHKTGKQMLRRSFSYAEGLNPRTSRHDTGLLFISFQRSPEQFITIQNSFGNTDKMNEYITHVGSGLFACFGGVKKGEYLGQALLES